MTAAAQSRVTAIYVVVPGSGTAPHLPLALARLHTLADRLVIVADPADAAHLRAAMGPGRVIGFSGSARGVLAGYRDALNVLRDEEDVAAGPLILTGSHVLGPTGDFAARVAAAADPSGPAIQSPYWHDTTLDLRIAGRHGMPSRIPYLDLAVLAPRVLEDPGFWAVWNRLKPSGNPRNDFIATARALAVWSGLSRHEIVYPMPPETFETAEPRVAEVHKLLGAGAYCLPVDALTLDPLLHDLEAIYLRDALDGLRVADPDLYAATIGFVSRHVRLRDFASAADQYEVLPGVAADPGKRAWNFGTVAVFIHAYYTSMMPEFWDLVRRLPCQHHLFLSAAGEPEKNEIETFLRDKGLSSDAFTVRAVEQNRGRDMSSLFITWRDVVLEGRYEVALRLHSKRTPQVSRQVGNSFKDHLFENLIGSRGHVANLLDRLEEEQDIGLVIPPVVHIGFDTLGHSWFNNRPQVAALCREMGIDVPLDEYTPMAPYGTMYWFRTEALRPMFERRWRWEDYHREPHHVDGGLAHVQERLIGYVAQGRGYRVLSVMTPRQAARAYAKLEYKMQFLTSHLMTGHILVQAAQLKAAQGVGVRLFRMLQNRYGKLLTRFPELRGPLKPAKQLVVALFAGRARN